MRTRIIVLAAGKGARMDSDLPKALVPLNDRPMISYLAESIVESNVDEKPIIVVSPDNQDIIKTALGVYDFDYAIQEKQLGTGHAVLSVGEKVFKEADNIIVLYCDHPFISVESISNISKNLPEVITIMPTKLDDFEGWRNNFYHWGRIVRNTEGEIEKIVEFKDASEEEKKITEVNSGFMRFNSAWLWENIQGLKNDNNQKEYYLTSLVDVAFQQKHKVGAVIIDPREAMGINSKAELAIAEDLLV
ncbi:MAG: NTP transferase domain-containing protein [Patescibacteria group bacterium]|nr:NTP transferase domain-containing protein [Patescibacteria group bacterium]